MNKSLFYLSTLIFIASSYAVQYEFIRDNKKEIVVSKKANLMWQDNSIVISNKLTWHDAIKYCSDLSFAGYSDWRLPSNIELFEINDGTLPVPCYKEGFKNTTGNPYWSSTSYAEYHNFVAFWVGGGGIGTDDKKYSNYVRCVRNIK